MAGPRYAADPPGEILKVELDGLTALYHRPSGTTHLLAAPAPQILDVLAKGPATLATIVSRLNRSFEVEAGEGVRLVVEARIAELESAGLVSRA